MGTIALKCCGGPKRAFRLIATRTGYTKHPLDNEATPVREDRWMRFTHTYTATLLDIGGETYRTNASGQSVSGYPREWGLDWENENQVIGGPITLSSGETPATVTTALPPPAGGELQKFDWDDLAWNADRTEATRSLYYWEAAETFDDDGNQTGHEEFQIVGGPYGTETYTLTEHRTWAQFVGLVEDEADPEKSTLTSATPWNQSATLQIKRLGYLIEFGGTNHGIPAGPDVFPEFHVTDQNGVGWAFPHIYRPLLGYCVPLTTVFPCYAKGDAGWERVEIQYALWKPPPNSGKTRARQLTASGDFPADASGTAYANETEIVLEPETPSPTATENGVQTLQRVRVSDPELPLGHCHRRMISQPAGQYGTGLNAVTKGCIMAIGSTFNGTYHAYVYDPSGQPYVTDETARLMGQYYAESVSMGAPEPAYAPSNFDPPDNL